MQAALILSAVMTVVGANQEAAGMEAQAKQYENQAKIYGSQIKMDQAENERRIAVEKAATAQESLDRTNKLRRMVGATTAKGAATGISTNYGSIVSLNEYSQSQASIEEMISRDNSNNRIVSLNLNSAVNQQNLAQAHSNSTFQASQLKGQAKTTRTMGYFKAGMSLFNGMNSGNSAIPTTQATGFNGTFLPASYGPQEQIIWNSK